MSHGQRFFKKSILSYEEKCLSSVCPHLKTINDSMTSDGQPLAIGGSPLAISCPPKAIGDLPMKIMVSSVLEIICRCSPIMLTGPPSIIFQLR